MTSNTPEDIGKPGLRIYAVETARADQAVRHGSNFAATVRSAESPIATADSDSPQRTLGAITAAIAAASGLVRSGSVSAASISSWLGFGSMHIFFFAGGFFNVPRCRYGETACRRG